MSSPHRRRRPLFALLFLELVLLALLINGYELGISQRVDRHRVIDVLAPDLVRGGNFLAVHLEGAFHLEGLVAHLGDHDELAVGLELHGRSELAWRLALDELPDADEL